MGGEGERDVPEYTIRVLRFATRAEPQKTTKELDERRNKA